MTIPVRLATLADAAAIADLTSQLGYDVAPSAISERLSRIIMRPDHILFVAEHDGAVVGWLHASIAEHLETDAAVVIGGLVVDRHHQGRGIGRVLMEHAENWARERECSIVRLRSSASRTGAHQFYERLGYSNIKTQYSFAKSLAGGALDMFVPRVTATSPPSRRVD
jgi:GNAT superfamily N-acetyltransferase